MELTRYKPGEHHDIGQRDQHPDSCIRSLHQPDGDHRGWGNAYYTSVDGVLFNKSLATLIQYPGGKTGSLLIPASVTSIGDYAFNASSGLTNVAIPASVASIGNWP
jgi:hypothetical protein